MCLIIVSNSVSVFFEVGHSIDPLSPLKCNTSLHFSKEIYFYLENTKKKNNRQLQFVENDMEPSNSNTFHFTPHIIHTLYEAFLCLYLQTARFLLLHLMCFDYVNKSCCLDDLKNNNYSINGYLKEFFSAQAQFQSTPFFLKHFHNFNWNLSNNIQLVH